MEKRRWPLFVHVTIGIVLALSIVVITNVGIMLGLLNSLKEFLTPLEAKTPQNQTTYTKSPKLTYSPLNVTNSQPLPSLTTPATINNSDYPPEDHPSKWDYIESGKKKCWFHKVSREKVCNTK